MDVMEALLRLVAATIAGGLLGVDRDIEQKALGVRTLALVSLSAAVVTVAGFSVAGMVENPNALSRVVQGVVQGVALGIGFIGAGVLLHRPDRREVKGLTTATTVWVAAALGIACGFAQWEVVALACTLAIGLLWLLKRVADRRGWDID